MARKKVAAPSVRLKLENMLMAKALDKSLDDLRGAVDAIGERIEISGRYSELFADANILKAVAPVKNQIIRGRRGTGKTHLLGRLNMYYRETYSKSRVLPVFVDGRKIAADLPMEEPNPVLTALIWYRRLLDTVVAAINDFARDKIVLTSFEKIWPAAEKKKRLRNVRSSLEELQAIVDFGDVQIGPGRARSAIERRGAQKERDELSVDAKLVANIKKLTETRASFGADFKKASVSSTRQRLKIVYEGLTVLNYTKITGILQRLIGLVNAEAFVLLFDEWSALDPNLQPIFAQMIRTTLIGGKQFAIKIGCIPFLTRLSETEENGQPIGFPIGEEIFVGADLDRLCDPFINSEEVTAFLLAVLQKHLGYTIRQFRMLGLREWVDYCSTNLFQGDAPIREIVQASAGVPRDFLLLFARAFRGSYRPGPIGEGAVRSAIHEFFQQEKRSLIEGNAKATSLYEALFSNICLPNHTYFFFVSQTLGTSRSLQELWHHRLLHLLFQGHVAFARGQPGTYDIYMMDYGRFASMRNTKRGNELYSVCETVLEYLVQKVLPQPTSLRTVLKMTNLDESVKRRFAKFMAVTSSPPSSNLADKLEDCSRYCADTLLLNCAKNARE
jgi:hypothetical protein